MRTFFYIPKQLPCNSECRWQSCPRRYLGMLQKQGSLRDIHMLHSRPMATTLQAANTPRHGDIVIMFAGDSTDLEMIIEQSDFFESTRNILVLADPEKIDGNRCHRLGPRYITQSERSVSELEAVVRKMKSSTNIESYGRMSL